MLSKIKPYTTEFVSPVASVLVRAGLRPNHLTVMGLFFGLLAAWFIVRAEILTAVVFVLLSSFCDLIDGAMARNEGLVTEFGGFLDSVVDRYVDVLLFIALGIYGVDWVVIAAAMSGALLVSYTRARAEKAVEKCDVGIAERSERLLILLAGMVSGYVYLAVLIIAVLSHITALHRVLYTYSQLKAT